MGSLSASGVPVVAKTSTSFRKRDKLITSTNSVDDTVTTLVDRRDALHRTIGSGSIVRDNGVVEYTEERVWGVQLFGRSTDARIARDGARNLSVDINDNETEAVIEASLVPDVPLGVWSPESAR